MHIAHTKLRDIEYRITGTGKHWAVLLYGGHTNAGIHLGEEYFTDRDYRILVVSRPGYGKTPISSGRTPDIFAEALHELMIQLGITKAIVVGISAAGRTAVRFAAKYPGATDKLILQSSISFAPWPGTIMKVMSYLAFNSVIEVYVWQLIRFFLKKNPKATVKKLISFMTILDPAQVVDNLNESQLTALADTFSKMASGKGFIADIQTAHNNAEDVSVPTLIIHSKFDKSVSLSHPQQLAKEIRGSQLFISEAESHMLWFSSHYEEIEKVMDGFLDQNQIIV